MAVQTNFEDTNGPLRICRRKTNKTTKQDHVKQNNKPSLCLGYSYRISSAFAQPQGPDKVGYCPSQYIHQQLSTGTCTPAGAKRLVILVNYIR